MHTRARATLRAVNRSANFDARPQLAATISPLISAHECADTREALAWASSVGYRGVQLSATEPGLRPRDLSNSARRDLAATLGRLELTCSGIDFFIPPAHFSDPVHVSRAFEAVEATLEFAATLGRAPVTVALGANEQCEIRHAIAAAASRLGVGVHLPVVSLDDAAAIELPFAASLDCATVLGAGGKPEELVARLGARLGSVRLVDLWRSGLRGAILEPRESRLDALALRVALEIAGFTASPLVDARQWANPRRGLEQVLQRWNALIPA